MLKLQKRKKTEVWNAGKAKCSSPSYLVNLTPQITNTLPPAIKENHTVDINSNKKEDVLSVCFYYYLVVYILYIP